MDSRLIRRAAALANKQSLSRLARLRALSTLAPAQHKDFELVKTERIAEHSAVASLYRHKATGAEVLSVTCNENDKVFGVALRTVPTDDTGVAHILEHSVLCGSAKYPTKEPFVELMKSSLQTYLNAMTYPDRTVYPVASPNVADFHNLVRVYLDAVFSPRLEPWVLQQEGHHTTPAGLDMDMGAEGQAEGGQDGQAGQASDASQPGSAATANVLKYKGVVFNEMKGVYSSADSVHGQACEEALFPDTAYSRSSGGDPLAIPRLSYEAFTQFHADNYAPGRARLFFFGDDPEDARLAIAAEALSQAVPGGTARASTGASPQPAPQQLTLAVQAPFIKPTVVHAPYPAAGSAPSADGGGDGPDPGFVVDRSLGPSGGLVQAAPSTKAEARQAQAAGSDGLPPFATQAVPGVPDEHFVTVNWCLTGGVLPPGASASTSSGPAGTTVLTETEVARAFTSEDRIGLALLSHLLMGTQASTVRKALTDSGLGSGVTGGGLDDGLLQPVFSAGLKGVKAADWDKVEPLVLHTVTMACGMGFEKDHITASVNTLEFQLREFASGGGPRGLSLFLGAAAGWTYGRDPLEELRYEDALKAVKAQLQAKGSAYFQDLLRRFVLNNPHRATVHSYPDPAWTARREEEEQRELLDKAKQLQAQPDGLKRIEEQAVALLERQATPDPPEALASIPCLTLEDLGTQQAGIPVAIKETPVGKASSTNSRKPAPFLVHEQPTAGIGYLALHFDLHALPARLLPLLPLFSWCMTSTGTKGMDEVTLSRALGANTGGVHASVASLEVPGEPWRCVPRLTLSGKALSEQGQRLGELLSEIAVGSRLDARERIVHGLKDTVGRHKAGLVGSGHRYAGGLLSACMSLPGWLSEQWGGLTGMHVARSLLYAAAPSGQHGLEASLLPKLGADAWRAASDEWTAAQAGPVGVSSRDSVFVPPSSFEALVADLEEIRTILLTQASIHSSVSTGDEKSLTAMETALNTVVSALPGGQGGGSAGQGKHTWPSPAQGSALTYATVRAYSEDKGTAQTTMAALLPSTGGQPSSAAPATIVGLVAPSSQVNYVAKAAYVGQVYRKGKEQGAQPTAKPLPGGAEVSSAVLRNGYLWEKVRVQGGAYGGFASLNRHSGNLSFASYRDPHVSRTLSAFDGSAAHLTALADGEGAIVRDELRKAIISTIGGIDAPMAPAERGDVSATRWAMGISQDMLQARRDQVLSTSADDLRAFATAAAHVAKHGRVAVVGNEAALSQAAQDGYKVSMLRPLQ